MDKHLNVGVYEATGAFRSIKQHSCVCFDDMGLVAVTGPAEDKEAQKYADLFAAAPDMLDALQEFLVDHTTDAKSYLTSNPTQCNCVTCNKARTAIAKAKGEVLEHAND